MAAVGSEPDEVREVALKAVAGTRVLPLSAVALVGAAALIVFGARAQIHGGASGGRAGFWIGAAVLAAAASAGIRGLISVRPGDAVVVQFLGSYVGSLRSPGLWWVNPWAKRRRISTKVRSHHTDILKLNDKEGIPVEMAMVINWRVGDTARAVYAVEDLADFVRLHCEMSMRQLAAGHRYEPEAEGAPSLAGRTQALIEELSGDVARRLAPAGIAVVETEIVRLAYAPEIAQAMLRRQQAAAIVAARQQIVEGAVGMVELALDRLDREHIVDLDEERKATMVSNLLVVLCSDHPAQPMINAGSLYL